MLTNKYYAYVYIYINWKFQLKPGHDQIKT